MENKDYSVFTLADFLEDKDFLRFVKYKSPNDTVFWNDWQSKTPQNLNNFVDARNQLQIILSPARFVPAKDLEETLLNDIKNSIEKNKKLTVLRRRNYFWYSGLAASLTVGIFSLWFLNSVITIHSDFGEIKHFRLPDGTDITLNSNSTLTYPRAYTWRKVRTVSLLGEAYFKVEHLNQSPDKIKEGELFQATTGSVLVQVLGTEFNLKDRHGKAYVALINGKVRISSIKTGRNYVMQPGNVIRLDAANGELILDNKNGSSVQSAWIDGKITVNQTSVKDIITAFEDLYGYKVILDDPALGNKKIDGSISIRSEQGLLFTLSNILNVNIIKEGKIIRLESRR